MSDTNWYALKDTSNVNSPSLLVYPERIEENIRTMISMAGGYSMLRPHIKTHKMAQIVQMQQRHGIQKFKCATIAEAELLGRCKAEDVLLAMQPVGSNIQRFFQLMATFPSTQFATLVDNQHTLGEIGEAAAAESKIAFLYLDINNGMNRTGCLPDAEAVRLYRAMEEHPHIVAKGLHVYDGHIRDSDIEERSRRCNAAFDQILKLKEAIKKDGVIVPNLVAGGSPSFPIHSKRPSVEASPGTTLLWDARYGDLFPDMHFLHAAVLFIRIISKPTEDTLCFDLGHKSVAPEMDFPRVRILGLEDSEQIGQSEEHLVVRSTRANEFEVGDAFYAIPMHICPTVAKYEEVLTVTDGAVTGSWKVAARNQRITI
ncbi:D-TA family PLP-dependent enzyme [Flavobacteriaceae bacterium TP-CH-4]|uniref:D-TA family PLP-dependent enzyme n=2 Tax=Pelagihabitans pacificus TaxID=2696054 RepID=A0A967ECT5_9FLAO|nr:D-TA family PLP-dependent enzyme [Pelagihabitans pacificus]